MLTPNEKLGRHSALDVNEGEVESALKGPARGRSKVWIVVLLGAVLVLVACLFAVSTRQRQDRAARAEASAEAHSLPSVQTAIVTRAPSGGVLEIPGTTAPLTEAYIYSRASGYLQRRFVDIGDRVRAGQVLAIVSAPDLDQQVRQADSGLQQTQSVLGQMQAQLRLATLTWNRWKVLVAKGVFSRQDGDTQEANYRVAVANVRAAEANVGAANANLDHLRVLQGFERITAPFDGVITARNVDVGALISAQGSGLGHSSVSAGGTQAAGLSNVSGASGGTDSASRPSTGEAQGGQLFTEADTERLRILVSIPGSYSDAVKPGQTAELHFEGLPDASYTGRVTRTADALDTNTRTMLTEIQVSNRSGRLKPGMYTVVGFKSTVATPPLIIPGDAIVIRKDHDAVALIQQGIVHFVPVTVGRDYGNVTQILGGLSEGQTVAVDVTDDVKEGTRVNAIQQGARQPASNSHSHANADGGQYGPKALTNNPQPDQRSSPSRQRAGRNAGVGQ